MDVWARDERTAIDIGYRRLYDYTIQIERVEVVKDV